MRIFGLHDYGLKKFFFFFLDSDDFVLFRTQSSLIIMHLY